MQKLQKCKERKNAAKVENLKLKKKLPMYATIAKNAMKATKECKDCNQCRKGKRKKIVENFLKCKEEKLHKKQKSKMDKKNSK